MNGAHDLGGMHGFGPIDPERDEPVFHAEWERRAFAITLAAGALGKWNLDMSRYAREQMRPDEYLATSYYEHWLFGLEKLLVEQGLLTQAELATGRPAGPGPVQALPLEKVAESIRRGGAFRGRSTEPARFAEGQAVRVRNRHPSGHTRAPRYVRGRQGVIVRDHGVYIFPDTNAMGQGPQPQHCYSVRFTAQELWGPEARAGDSVLADLWDAHLEAVG